MGDGDGERRLLPMALVRESGVLAGVVSGVEVGEGPETGMTAPASVLTAGWLGAGGRSSSDELMGE